MPSGGDASTHIPEPGAVVAESAHRVPVARPVVMTTAHLATWGQRGKGAPRRKRLQELVLNATPLAHVRDVKHRAVGRQCKLCACVRRPLQLLKDGVALSGG